MVVQWFEVFITGEELVLEGISDWVNANITPDDFRLDLGVDAVFVRQFPGEEYFYLKFSVFIKNTVSLTKYPNRFKTKLKTLNKTGINTVLAQKYNSCSHDSVSPLACQPVEVYSYGYN